MKNFEFIDSIKFPFPITQMVAWGDMDAFQHVNNVQYFRYFETGRVELFNKTNLWKLIEAENIRFVVGKLECNYLQELVHPAEIEISVGIKKIGNASLVLHQMVKSDRNIVAHGEAIVVATNPSTGKSTPWTDNIRTAFEKWL